MEKEEYTCLEIPKQLIYSMGNRNKCQLPLVGGFAVLHKHTLPFSCCDISIYMRVAYFTQWASLSKLLGETKPLAASTTNCFCAKV